MSRRSVNQRLVLLVALALAGVAAAADPSLVGWWAFDETSGTVASDSSEQGNHGTVYGDAQWVPGQAEGSLRLDGVDDYVEIPTLGSVISTLDDCTLAIWVDWAGGGAWQRIYDIGTGSITNYSYIYLCPSTGSTNAMRVAVVAGNGTWDEFDSRRAALAGGWHHVTVTINGATRTMVMYLDGEPIGSMTNMTNKLSDLGNTSQNWLGRSTYVADPYFNGLLDDFRIFNRVLTRTEVRQVMRGMSETAGMEDPPHKTADVATDVILSWSPGRYAKTHDVYLGTSLEDVTAATRTDLRGVLASQNQDANTYPVGRLAFGQTYYWRVDEVNAPPTDSTLFQGDVWRFTTEPYAYPVKPILAKASSSFNASLQPIKTIDGSGLNEYDGHSTTQTHMWLSGKTPQPPWVEYEFDQVYKLHEMWVWNQNQAKEVANLGYGARDVTITYSTDGTNWTALPDVPEFAQGTAEPNYLHNTTVSFGGALARVVRLTINSNWGSATKQAGLSEVRFFQAPLYARAPQPAPGATDVSLDSTLYWRTGREAAQHAVYLGTDSNEVLNGTAPVRTVAENRVPLTSVGAEYDRTYYWRVDEVNSAAAVQSWPGQEVWSFATTPYSVVDDFESYTEEKGNHIYEAWVDGWDSGGTNGSVVGNPDVEMAIVHGGGQSMPFSYDSTAGASVSEATRTFDTPQDWTQGGVRTLVLFFRGEWDNGIGQLYVRINDTQVSYAGDTQAMARPLWKQWNIDLASLPGLQAVRSVTLGVSGAVRGKLYVDDLRLYRAAPEVPSPVDPGTAGLAASYSFEGDVKDGSGHKLDGTAVNDPRYVDSLSGLGKAIELDGVNDHVVLPIGTVISTLTSTTIATWVNFDTGSTGQWQRVFDFGTYSVDVNGVSDPNFYMFLSPRILTNGVIRFGITTNGNAAGAESIVSSLNMMPGGWSHLAVVIEAGADANTVQVYLNGDVVARGTTATLPRDLGVTDQNWLGRSQYDADGYLGAGLDEFRIYDRALSPAEIRYLAGDR